MTQSNIPSSFPAVSSPEEVEEMLVSFSAIATLTPKQKALLMAIVTDFMSEQHRTQVQMASDLGIAQSTIIYNLANPKFNVALGTMMVCAVRGQSHKYLENMRKLADKGHYQANKFMLEYGGTYTKRSSVTTKNLNMSIQAHDIRSGHDFNESVDQFLIMCGERGISAERLVGRYNELRAEQAW